MIVTLVLGYSIGRYQASIRGTLSRAIGVDPTALETYAVLKSPDREWACVVTRQNFDIDFLTFTFWWLDPHTHELLFPIVTAPMIVRENLEEGPPTKDVRLSWEGDEVFARFFWGDGSPSWVIHGNWRTGWQFGERPTTQPLSRPSTSPAARDS